MQTRSNSCAPGGQETQSCNTQPCACTWGAWSACSTTACGTTGIQSRSDNCGNTQTQSCVNPPCACGDVGDFTLNPISGNLNIQPNREVTLSWTPALGAGAYDVQVFPTGTLSGEECSAANTFCAVQTTSTTFTFTAPVGVTNYSWRVRGVNTACSPEALGEWEDGGFTLVGELSGNIYFDDLSAAVLNVGTGQCELSGTLVGQEPGSEAIIQALWSGSGVQDGTITGTTFSVSSVPNIANISLTLVPDTSQYRCTCPAGCTLSGLSVPSIGNNFFLARSAQAWWQTQNGLVYAGGAMGNAIVSFVPETAVTGAYLSLKNSVSTLSSSGIAITGGGDIDSTLEITTKYSRLREDTEQARVIGSRYEGARESYQYFYMVYSMGSSPTADFTNSKPTIPPANGRAYYGAGNQTIDTNWDVSSGENLVIFVNGNLTIDANIVVEEGGFVAFIVSGDITFSNTLGSSSPSDTASTVEGVFIGNRIIVQGGLTGGDLKFIGEGTFVGWSGVQLQRTYANSTDNDSYPTELFRFRPDFVMNIPDRMTRPIISWQEVN